MTRGSISAGASGTTKKRKRHGSQTDGGGPPADRRPLRYCPEAEVVASARNGDREAFSELVHRNERYLKGSRVQHAPQFSRRGGHCC
jgi:hypothetical protein